MQSEHTPDHPKTLTVHPAPRERKGESRRHAMNRLGQGMATVGLVASLGLVVPGSFGGSASADPALNDHNNTFPLALDCDLDRDGVYETGYETVSTAGAFAFHDTNSSTVLVISFGEVHRDYTALPPDEPGGPEGVDVSADYGFGPGFPKGKKHGQKSQAVPCHEDPLTGEFETVGDGFPVDANGNPVEVEGANYHVVQQITWWVTLSGDGKGRVQGASADDGGVQSADRTHQGKHKNKQGGKHRGKGTRGR